MKRGIIIMGMLVLLSGLAQASLFDSLTSWFSTGHTELIAAQSDPVKVYPGQNLKLIVEVEDTAGIESAVALFPHEAGVDEVPLILTASNEANHRYTYTANWEVHDTENLKWYNTTFHITNTKGETITGLAAWQDPTVSHPAAQIDPGTFPTGTYTFPGTVSAGDLSCSGGNCISGADIDESSLGTVPSASSASSASSAGSVSCSNCIGGSQVDESSLSGTASSLTSGDLSCTNCIGGTEIDESGLSGTASSLTAGSATFAGLCSALGDGNRDFCFDLATGWRCTQGSCADGTCNSCSGTGAWDMVVSCSGGRVSAVYMLSSGAC